jgi:hypothetical protein
MMALMTKEQKAILRWWKGFRPIGWTIRNHMENPIINTTRGHDGNLAKLAGKIANMNYNNLGKGRKK